MRNVSWRRTGETIRVPHETGFGDDEDILKPCLAKQAASGHDKNRVEIDPDRQGTVMIKALSAIAIAAFIAAALTILPGFAPQVEASEPVALAKGDRLDIRPIGRDCSQQAWPHFEANCLRNAATKTVTIREVRLVTTERP
jgi:hypothetical protein